MDNFQDAVIYTDSKGKIKFGNLTARQYFIKGQQEIIGQNIQDILNLTDTENGDHFTKIMSDLLDRKKSIAKLRDRIFFLEDSGISLEQRIIPLSTGDEDQGWVFLYRDITERIKSELELEKDIGKLRNIIGNVIQAMAQTVEARDQYTAGHQRRVSHIARMFAKKMGLPGNEIEGIRTAGVIHDMGKISVPGEILSKPAFLSDIELSLIKQHPQVGYDICRNIDFPWPVAKIVLQHHERINGTGYPQQLSGDEILLEAKVIAVADVVEAMSSHRPYRPSLGMDKAIEEVNQNKGIFYDETVVDACVTLYKADELNYEQ